MALRLSKVYPGASDYAATEFKAALANSAGSISSNDDNFKLDYPGGNFRNPDFNRYDGRKDYGESETMTTVLKGLNNDKRLDVYGAAADGSPSTKGVPFGHVRTFIDPWCQQNTDWAYVLAPAYRKETSPCFIVRASSVLLARAEAADRGWTSETANTKALYEAGISASFTQWGLNAPGQSYLAALSVALPSAFGTGANLSFIATQQWVAYYPDGTRGWANWRRTNYPALTPAVDATNSPKVIPRRYMYGTSDYALTKTGVEAAVAKLTGGDKMDSRIWWDKQ